MFSSFRRSVRCVVHAVAIGVGVVCAHAGALRLSTADPIIVTAPIGWQAVKDKPATPQFPFETYRVFRSGGLNAICLVSVLARNDARFTDREFLQKIARDDGRPFVKSAKELEKVDLHELKIDGGLGFYADFVDPDLVGKPVKQGQYKVATPVTLSIGKKYLIKVTVFTDDAEGPDHRDLLKIVETIRELKLI